MKIIKVHEDCRVVKGANRASIVDLGRNNHYLIPLQLADILFKYQGRETSQLFKDYKTEKEEIDQYLYFLEEKEIIFYVDSRKEYNFFPLLSLEWDFPSFITNAIIDIVDIKKVTGVLLEQLEALGCVSVSFRFYLRLSLTQLSSLLERLSLSSITAIDITLPFSKSFSTEVITSLCKRNPRLNRIFFFNSPIQKVIDSDIDKCIIFFIVQNINCLNCGVVHWDYFTTNTPHYTESQKHNTCLNRKIAIDSSGNIKNCPSMAKSYGNIKDTKLIDVVNNPEFQKLWYIHKDQISVCKDCEFRHICTDCRAYLENPKDVYSKPLKCGYNPYTCEWEEWSTNPLKQQAIDYYEMREIINK